MTTETQLAQPFTAMDCADEKQILAEMRTEFLTQFVYSYKRNNQTITHLSYIGVKECIRRLADQNKCSFTLSDPKVEETSEVIRVTLKLHDNLRNIDLLGASEAPKDTPFAYVLAVNKAERNALAKLIPANFIAALIQEYLTQSNHVQYLGADVSEPPVKNVTSAVATQQPVVPADLPLPIVPIKPPLQPSTQSSTAPVNPQQSTITTKPQQSNSQQPTTSTPQSSPKIKPVSEAPKIDWHNANFDLPMPELKQVPLHEGEAVIGIMNVYTAPNSDPSEVTLVPTEPLKLNLPAFTHFLMPKVLDVMTGLTYTIFQTKEGNLAYIWCKTKFTSKQLSDLHKSAQWAFGKAHNAST